MSYIELFTDREREVFNAGWEEGFSDCLAHNPDWERAYQHYLSILAKPVIKGEEA